MNDEERFEQAWRKAGEDHENAAEAMARLLHEVRIEALQNAAKQWKRFVYNGLCPVCERGSRETVGMICMTCGKDYSKLEES